MGKIIFFLILVMAFTCSQAEGQGQRRRINNRPVPTFGAAVLGGRNFSQMDGDYFTGFNKGGWYGGLRGIVHLSSRASINVETLYCQKGSKIPHGVIIMPNSVNDRVIAMDFAEIPILLKYNLTPEASSLFVEFGGYYGKLLDTRIEELPANLIQGTVYREIVSEFKSSEFGLVGGLGFGFRGGLDITMRYSFALSKIYMDPDFELPPPGSLRVKEVEFLRNYYLTLMAAYKFL